MKLPRRVLLLVIAAASACGGQGEQPGSSPQAVPAAPAPAPDPALVNPHTEPSPRLALCTVRLAPGEDPGPAMRPGATLCFEAGVHPGTLTITTPVTLVGEPGTILDGAGAGPAVHIAGDRLTVAMDSLTLTGGPEAPGAALLVDHRARLSLTHVHFAGSASVGMRASAGQISVTDSVFAGDDGLVIGDKTQASVTGTTVAGDVTIDGAAQVQWTGGSVGSMTLAGSAEHVPRVILVDMVGPVTNDPDHPATLIQE